MGDMLRRAVHLDDWNWIPQPDTSPSEQATDLPDDVEDRFRKALYDLFDLKPLELLVLRGIMKRMTLQEIANELEDLFKRNDKDFTRFHAFQLRKSILNKKPELKDALLTEGQKKRLKK